jgi:hypothetical protein
MGKQTVLDQSLHPRIRPGSNPALTRDVWRPTLTANDNAGFADGMAHDGDPLEPRWDGPGEIAALGTRDGRHELGLVRAIGAGEAGLDVAILSRLLTYYGRWLGFEGEATPMQAGRLRHLPTPVGGLRQVEYRLDLRRINRRAQILSADGTILMNGRQVVTLDDFAVSFRLR